MTTDESRRQRLLDELVDLLSEAEPFGFGIISTKPPKEVATQKLWEEVAHTIPAQKEGEDAYYMESSPKWVEPLPGGTACIRWTGDSRAVKQFQKWASRASRVLVDEGILTQEQEAEAEEQASPKKRSPRMMRLVRSDPGLQDVQPLWLIYELVFAFKRAKAERVRTIVFDLKASWPSAKRKQFPVPKVGGVPVSLTFNGLPTFDSSVATLAFASLAKLRGKPLLTVNTKTNLVTFKGEPRKLDMAFVLVLDCIVKAMGRGIRSKDMREIQPKLQGEGKIWYLIRRKLRKEWKELEQIIEGTTFSGYSIPERYLE